MKLIASLTSPYARKIRVALAEKAIPFDLEVDIPWLPHTSVPRYNPLGKVPVLVADDGRAWFDSPVIAEYLETLPGGARALLPAERVAALPVKQAEALADGVLDAAVAAFLERQRPDAQRSDAAVARQLGKIELGLEALAARLAAQDGVGADAEPNLADIALACCVGYLDFRFPELDWRPRQPALAAFADRLLARPSFVDTRPPAP